MSMYVCEYRFVALILSLLTTLVTISLQGCTRWVFPCYPFFTSSSIYLLAGFHFYALEMHSLHSIVCEREPLFARFNQKIVKIRWWIVKIGRVAWKKKNIYSFTLINCFYTSHTAHILTDVLCTFNCFKMLHQARFYRNKHLALTCFGFCWTAVHCHSNRFACNAFIYILYDFPCFFSH